MGILYYGRIIGIGILVFVIGTGAVGISVTGIIVIGMIGIGMIVVVTGDRPVSVSGTVFWRTALASRKPGARRPPRRPG